QRVSEREPLTALSQGRELAVPLLFERPAAALEREELVVPDRGQPLTRPLARADLHACAESQVVDDGDDRSG
ncbi:MAG: hypothetical protein K0S49_2418, partial [Microbacterium sp.]|nr:hypothetical protein [Microbacterium sp.]